MSYFIYTDLMESFSWSKTCWSWINFDLLWCIWLLVLSGPYSPSLIQNQRVLDQANYYKDTW